MKKCSKCNSDVLSKIIEDNEGECKRYNDMYVFHTVRKVEECKCTNCGHIFRAITATHKEIKKYIEEKHKDKDIIPHHLKDDCYNGYEYKYEPYYEFVLTVGKRIDVRDYDDGCWEDEWSYVSTIMTENENIYLRDKTNYITMGCLLKDICNLKLSKLEGEEFDRLLQKYNIDEEDCVFDLMYQLLPYCEYDKFSSFICNYYDINGIKYVVDFNYEC